MNVRDQTGVGLGGSGCGVPWLAPCIALAKRDSRIQAIASGRITQQQRARDKVIELSFDFSTIASVSPE